MRDASTITTEKLYYLDAYATVFKAEVLRVEGTDVVLDRTLFFPEEGGQIADRGILGGLAVKDVKIRDGEIHHRIDAGEAQVAAAFVEGSEVEGRIDWKLRFSNMQQHSGEHIFSGIVNRRLGFDNVGFHLSEREVTLDFNGVIPEDVLTEIEMEANRAITSNVETKILFTTKEERAGIAYRSKLDLEGEVRLVEYPGYDICACCAPHVKRSGEIGLLKVVSMINYKGGVRVSILCGERAMELFRKDHGIVTETANYLTTSADQIYPQVVKAKQEVQTLKASLKQAATALLDIELRGVDPQAENVYLFFDGLDMTIARDAVNRLTAQHSGCSGIFVGSDENGYSYVIGAGEGTDARTAAQKLKEAFGARGGGKPVMVQGSVGASEKKIRDVLESGCG